MASPFDLLVRGATLIDPAQSIAARRDVAFSGGRVTAVAETLAGEATEVIDAAGALLTPGLIDLHTHVYHGLATGRHADQTCLANGVTTVVDAGSAGWMTLRGLRDYDLRAGDIATHIFNGNAEQVLGRDGKVLREVRAAQEHGVVFRRSHRQVRGAGLTRARHDRGCGRDGSGGRPVHLPRRRGQRSQGDAPLPHPSRDPRGAPATGGSRRPRVTRIAKSISPARQITTQPTSRTHQAST